MKWYTALGRRLGTTRWFPRFARPWLGRADLALYTATKGRIALSPKEFHSGVLETIGARSGQIRRVLLYFGRLGNSHAVAASNYGSGKIPDWAFNLRAHPEATLELDGTRKTVRAIEITGSRQKELWEALDAVFPGYAEYRKRVHNIPLFVLESQS